MGGLTRENMDQIAPKTHFLYLQRVYFSMKCVFENLYFWRSLSLRSKKIELPDFEGIWKMYGGCDFWLKLN